MFPSNLDFYEHDDSEDFFKGLEGNENDKYEQTFRGPFCQLQVLNAEETEQILIAPFVKEETEASEDAIFRPVLLAHSDRRTRFSVPSLSESTTEGTFKRMPCPTRKRAQPRPRGSQLVRDNSQKADVVIKKLFRPARKVTKLQIENRLGSSPTFELVYKYVRDEVLRLGDGERVPVRIMAEFMGAINKRYEKT